MLKEIQNYNLYHHRAKDMNKIYHLILSQIKTTLLVNTKQDGCTLKFVAESVLNSNQLIKQHFKNKGKVAEVIKKLHKKFEKYFKIEYHSSKGPVVVLINKNFEIPDVINLE